MAQTDETSKGITKPNDEQKTDSIKEEPQVVRFSPKEEESLLSKSHEIKAEANSLFNSKDHQTALSKYKDALSSCPNYLHYERAVIQSNIAACHLKLEDWEDAIKTATEAIDGLAKLEPKDPKETKDKDAKENLDKTPNDDDDDDDDDDVEEEIVSSGAACSAPSPAQAAAETRKSDISRIRIKALLRRARARSEAGGWQNLAGAEEDYRALSQTPGLTPADMRTVRSQLVALPPRTKAAQEAEMAEMWGKLKGLGNSILRPFGLSTDNFQMVKDENTGGYSMNFNQGNGKTS